MLKIVALLSCLAIVLVSGKSIGLKNKDCKKSFVPFSSGMPSTKLYVKITPTDDFCDSHSRYNGKLTVFMHDAAGSSKVRSNFLIND